MVVLDEALKWTMPQLAPRVVAAVFSLKNISFPAAQMKFGESPSHEMGLGSRPDDIM